MISEPEVPGPPPGEKQSAGSPSPERQREVDELTFLVGTACSRTINLLMQVGADREALREELEFLSTKAARLAALLR